MKPHNTYLTILATALITTLAALATTLACVYIVHNSKPRLQYVSGKPDPQRTLPQAVHDDLGMDYADWLDQSQRVASQVGDMVAEGHMPTMIRNNHPEPLDTHPTTPLEQPITTVLTKGEEFPPAVDWGKCSPGVPVRISHPGGGTASIGTLTAAHCAAGMGVPADGKIIPSSRWEQGEDMKLGDTKQGDLAIVHHTTGEDSSFWGTLRLTGFAPLVPGMEVCSFGSVSGWRCGKMGDELFTWKRSGFTYGVGDFPIRRGDSGGVVILGSWVVGVNSFGDEWVREDEGGERSMDTGVSSVWSGVVAAWKQGYEVAPVVPRQVMDVDVTK